MAYYNKENRVKRDENGVKKGMEQKKPAFNAGQMDEGSGV